MISVFVIGNSTRIDHSIGTLHFSMHRTDRIDRRFLRVSLPSIETHDDERRLGTLGK